MDDTTLLLNLLLFQEQTVGPVPQNHEAGVDNRLARRGYITYIIDRLVDRSVGVQVVTKLHTDGLAPAQQFVALEVLRAVEGHVLEEVSQTALRVVLLNRAHLLGNVELGALFGPVVVTNVISQSVVKFTDAHVGVNGDGGHLLSSYRQNASHGQHYQTNKFPKIHHFCHNVYDFSLQRYKIIINKV